MTDFFFFLPVVDNESKCFSSLHRKSYKGTPTLSESMSCVVSCVQLALELFVFCGFS